jgi:NAD(P)-dependent dehydrogenase (short-subunit alcohol dehydrogenase family)
MSKDTTLDRREFLGKVTLSAGAVAGASALLGSAVMAPRVAQAADAPSWNPPLANVKGKVAFVTGGSSGIGLGIARALSGAGMKVVFTYLTDKHKDNTLAQFKTDNAKAEVHAIRLDIADRDAWVKAADEAEKVFGKVHLLVNNAGVGVGSPISKASFNDWDWGISVNVNGIFSGVTTMLPRILKHGEGGHIVSTSSMSGMFAGGSAGVYTTTKFAVVGMMEALRSEMLAQNQNIGVSVYVPGVVNSDIRHGDRNRPEALKGQPPPDLTPEQKARFEQMIKLPPVGMDPLVAGGYVLRGIQNNDLYIISHPEYAQGMQERCDAIMASVPVEGPAPPERVAVEKVVLTNAIYPAERDRKRAQKPAKK